MADTDIALAAVPAPPVSPVAGALARWQAFRQSPLARRAMVPAVVVALFGGALLAWLLLSDPGRAPLYRSLPDSDKAAVVEALREGGFAVALDPQSGAVMLPIDDHAAARMLLAGLGLPKAAPGGAEMLGDMPIGSSRAVEGARLKSAQERELARSIEALQGVESARVILATPEASPFVRNRAPVTASVTVTLAPGRTLSDGQARAILYLVAGAVPGLAPDNVAIADQTGRLLSADIASSADRAQDQRLQMQARLEAKARDSIIALLVPMFGADAVSAQVAVELDFAAREAAREAFEREGSLRSEATSRNTATEPRAMGIPGALTNTVPAAATVTAQPPAAVASGPQERTSSNESATRNYEIGRSLEVTTDRGGTVRRLTAAVAIRADALGPEQGRAAVLKEMEVLVASAIGADVERGDRVSIAARPFVPPAQTQIPLWREPVLIESSKWLAFAIVALAILLLLVRPMLRRAAILPAGAKDGGLLVPEGMAAGGQAGLVGPGGVPVLAPVDYADKLQQARLLAATDAARTTAVARRLLAGEAR